MTEGAILVTARTTVSKNRFKQTIAYIPGKIILKCLTKNSTLLLNNYETWCFYNSYETFFNH